MSFLTLLPGILRTIGSVLNIGKAKDVADTLESISLTPEQRSTLAVAMVQHEEELKRLNIEEMKTALSESLAMIASPDRYVSRARPTGLYIFYAASTAIVVGMLVGVKLDPTAILTVLAPLAGVGGYYVSQRTREKLNGSRGD